MNTAFDSSQSQISSKGPSPQDFAFSVSVEFSVGSLLMPCTR